jgi:inorganic phosphate transporter, PiT family
MPQGVVMTVALIIAVLWLAYSNGANDNFKGVATLYGSGAMSFRRAQLWAAAATLAGCLVSVVLAAALAKRFTGCGLVPQAMASDPTLLVSVGAAGAATILLATLLGMPTSTTHALTGALVGVALLINGGTVPMSTLWTSFFLPLLASPVIAVVLAAGGYLLFRGLRFALGLRRETCVCVGPSRAPVPLAIAVSERSRIMAGGGAARLSVTVGERAQCVTSHSGALVGVDAQAAVDVLHRASAGAVCFARAVNDTPKIAALLMVAEAIAAWKLAVVAAAMVAGGLLQGRRVAETMSKRITTLNAGQGLSANLVTALLVIGASRLGLPVSTTHVSVGSIFGIGIAERSLHWKTVAHVGVAWITTLPVGAALGTGAYFVLTRVE